MSHECDGTVEEAALETRPHYTAYIRFPFPRGDFVNPPLIDWDASKDKALWKILSRNPRSSDIDWKKLADKFDVTLDFILQQAAWLYQNHLSEMKLQMQRIGQSGTASPTPPLPALAPEANLSTDEGRGSRDSGRSVTVAAEPFQDPAPVAQQRLPMRSRGNSYQGKVPPMSRNTSTNTITQSHQFAPGSPGRLGANSSRGHLGASPRQRGSLTRDLPSRSSNRRRSESSSSDESSKDSSSEESGSRSQLGKSQTFRRAPTFAIAEKGKANAARGEDDDEDEDEEPAFFTFAKPEERNQQDMGATLRNPAQKREEETRPPISVTKINSNTNTDSSASSIASSAAPVSSPQGSGRGHGQRPPGPLSPRQRAQISAQSPRGRGIPQRDGSDDTRSMGSSFSDLDGFSGTQSALEEAYVSQMQRGGMGSRISNIGEALRSRYS